MARTWRERRQLLLRRGVRPNTVMRKLRTPDLVIVQELLPDSAAVRQTRPYDDWQGVRVRGPRGEELVTGADLVDVNDGTALHWLAPDASLRLGQLLTRHCLDHEHVRVSFADDVRALPVTEVALANTHLVES